jgi:hypothetical protein
MSDALEALTAGIVSGVSPRFGIAVTTHISRRRGRLSVRRK